MHNDENARAVARGAALLDEKFPDWYKRIDLDALAMDNCCRCVLGQLFGLYSEGAERIGLWYNGGFPGATERVNHGFVRWTQEETVRLNPYWIAAIQERLNAQ